MTEHSILSPSSAARRMQCPGSRAMEAKIKNNEKNEAAIEGEAAHFVAAIFIGNYATPRVGQNLTLNNGIEFTITQEMIDGAQLYYDFIINTLKLENIRIEEQVAIKLIHDECFGTPDCVGKTENNTHLHIVDYKFGHRYVEVFENWQLIEYAAAFFGVHKYEKISLHIVQPRCFHPQGQIRTWTLTYNEILKYFEKLHISEYLSMIPDAPLIPGEGCIFCKARHVCSALSNAALNISDIYENSNTPFELTANELGIELKHLQQSAKLIDARITGLEEQAKARIKRGERIPNFKLEQTTGREIWIKPIDQVLSLGEMFGVNLAKPQEAITPKQAIKLGIPKETVSEFSEVKQGELKLVQETQTEAKKIFSNKG